MFLRAGELGFSHIRVRNDVDGVDHRDLVVQCLCKSAISSIEHGVAYRKDKKLTSS